MQVHGIPGSLNRVRLQGEPLTAFILPNGKAFPGGKLGGENNRLKFTACGWSFSLSRKCEQVVRKEGGRAEFRSFQRAGNWRRLLVREF